MIFQAVHSNRVAQIVRRHRVKREPEFHKWVVPKGWDSGCESIVTKNSRRNEGLDQDTYRKAEFKDEVMQASARIAPVIGQR